MRNVKQNDYIFCGSNMLPWKVRVSRLRADQIQNTMFPKYFMNMVEFYEIRGKNAAEILDTFNNNHLDDGMVDGVERKVYDILLRVLGRDHEVTKEAYNRVPAIAIDDDFDIDNIDESKLFMFFSQGTATPYLIDLELTMSKDFIPSFVCEMVNRMFYHYERQFPTTPIESISDLIRIKHTTFDEVWKSDNSEYMFERAVDMWTRLMREALVNDDGSPRKHAGVLQYIYDHADRMIEEGPKVTGPSLKEIERKNLLIALGEAQVEKQAAEKKVRDIEFELANLSK